MVLQVRFCMEEIMHPSDGPGREKGKKKVRVTRESYRCLYVFVLSEEKGGAGEGGQSLTEKVSRRRERTVPNTA